MREQGAEVVWHLCVRQQVVLVLALGAALADTGEFRILETLNS